MFLGRNEELQYLENHYQKGGSQMVVLYGRKHLGKTTLIKEFVQSKSYAYYLARPCSQKEQLIQWFRELLQEDYNLETPANYETIFSVLTEEEDHKKIIVIDEFHNMVKAGDEFMNELIKVLHEQWNQKQVMIVLCSSSIGWIENSMVKKIGKAAYEISGFYKIKELDFIHMKEYFPNFSNTDCMEVYGILGGVVGLWKYFDDSLSVRDNVIQNILTPGSFLFKEGQRQVSEELRETTVYHTILSAISCGKYKLNEIYLHTGFSRAKISVYLKNLMELEIVEKINSFELEGKDNVQKGIYRISNHYIHFWFRFLFQNASKLNLLEPKEYFERFIENQLKSYTCLYFSKVCMQYLKQSKVVSEFFSSERYGEWFGKTGIIDIVAQDEANHYLIGLCNWEKPIMEYEDYEWLLYSMKQAKVEPTYIYLFSQGRFDEKLYLESKVKKNIHLMDSKEL